jgi:hypothetical protein
MAGLQVALKDPVIAGYATGIFKDKGHDWRAALVDCASIRTAEDARKLDASNYLAVFCAI